MFLLPGKKFIIEELIIPTNKLLIKKGSTGFISTPMIGNIRRYDIKTPTIIYTVFFTRAGKSGRDRTTWSKLRVLHVKPCAKNSDKVRGLDHLVKIKTELVNLAIIKPNEFIAYLLSCYFYIAQAIYYCTVPPVGIIDNHEKADLIEKITREGIKSLAQYNHLDRFYVMVEAVNRNIESINSLLIRYHSDNPYASVHRRDEIIALRKCFAYYSLAVRKYMKKVSRNINIPAYLMY